MWSRCNGVDTPFVALNLPRSLFPPRDLKRVKTPHNARDARYAQPRDVRQAAGCLRIAKQRQWLPVRVTEESAGGAPRYPIYEHRQFYTEKCFIDDT